MKVALYLYGRNLDPEKVTSLLGLVPSLVQMKGGPRMNSSKHTAKTGIWMLRSSNSGGVSDQIDELLQKLAPLNIPLIKIPNVEEAHVDIMYPGGGDDNEREAVEMHLGTKQLKALVDYGVAIHITVY